ncbi:hypothetical protein M5689_020001 [Euphorbia peplus]|nr:hypothetical protein M5689_020001 [Euphorbia peplus]
MFVLLISPPKNKQVDKKQCLVLPKKDEIKRRLYLFDLKETASHGLLNIRLTCNCIRDETYHAKLKERRQSSASYMGHLSCLDNAGVTKELAEFSHLVSQQSWTHENFLISHLGIPA